MVVFKVFDKVKIKAGAVVFSKERPLGSIVTQPYEVQVHRVLDQSISPNDLGNVISWRTPGKEDDKDQDWTEAANAVLVKARGDP